MKQILSLLLAALAFSACKKSPFADDDDAPAAEIAAAAIFLEGKGVLLTDEMRANIGLRLAEVTDRAVQPVVTVKLRPLGGLYGLQVVSNPAPATMLSGSLAVAHAAALKPGAPVELRIAGDPASSEQGVVKSIEPAPLAASGEVELIVETGASITPGTRVEGLIRGEATSEVPTVPRAALLRTVEGTFVYVANAGFFMRTPVKTGACSDEFIEITDGLYAGDEVAIAAVMPLWMTELQTIRGGKACCAPGEAD